MIFSEHFNFQQILTKTNWLMTIDFDEFHLTSAIFSSSLRVDRFRAIDVDWQVIGPVFPNRLSFCWKHKGKKSQINKCLCHK